MKYRTKQPLVRGYADANLPDDTFMRDFERLEDRCNIGLFLTESAGLAVIDIDMHPNQPDGEHSFQGLIAARGALPTTAEARTGGGGRHLFFRQGQTPRSGIVQLAPGVELFFGPKLITLAPSINAGGAPYSWTGESLPDFATLPELPESWCHAADRPAVGPSRARGPSAAGRTPPGEVRDRANFDAVCSGCAFMAHWRDDARSLGYQEWFAGITIAARCQDGDDIVHQTSSQYRGYSREQTDSQIRSTLGTGQVEIGGPHRCDTIETTIGDGYCRSCERRGQIRSPIVLGLPRRREVAAAPSEAGNQVVVDAPPRIRKDSQGTSVWSRNHFVLVSNFTGRLIEVVTVHDGASTRSEYVIGLTLAGQRSERTFTVAASDLTNQSWLMELAGPDFIVHHGNGHWSIVLRSIQETSSEMQRRDIYAQTGWHLIAGNWHFLSAAGGIPALPASANAEVRLEGSLAKFNIPSPDSNSRLHIDPLYHFLQAMPQRIAGPLIAAILRAVLGPPDFSLFLFGSTGTGKTTVAAIAQAAFGTDFEPGNLPARWSDTGNSILKKLHAAKDCLAVVDDFRPGATGGEAARAQNAATQVFMGVGNQSGRARLDRNANLRPDEPPGSLLLGTGEQLPSGEAVVARMFTVEVRAGDVDLRHLGSLQSEHGRRNLRNFTAAFIDWLASKRNRNNQGSTQHADLSNIPGIGFSSSFVEWRERMGRHLRSVHPRTVSNAAHLHAALDVMRHFVFEGGAHVPVPTSLRTEIRWRREDGSERTFEEVVSMLHDGVTEAAQAQAEARDESSPAEVFLDAIQAALSSGAAHVATRDGTRPNDYEATAIGWHRDELSAHRPRGIRIGLLEGDVLMLQPTASLALVESMLSRTAAFPYGARAVLTLLRERGYLIEGGENRQVMGPDRQRKRYWCLRADRVIERCRERGPTFFGTTTTGRATQPSQPCPAPVPAGQVLS
jgi:hypothetical protein